ncbi:hypothetical protein O7599_27790 [Streptomyces sp. WMMC500]|uniref:hypothetical protein n=1 Tax=Streptomyces sp. WMMC500 TaxID=3015154 RepID=UPI00248BFC4D|nr:hypothetical protein [Streptomyces sp. WMMC500]WBB59348.1 hypothetical protein O7599_27790 [Streptomyces sp. WMMC500]
MNTLPPPPPNAPAPPSFGWYTNPRDLTNGEIDAIKRRLKVKEIADADGPAFLAHVAVAFARRENPQRYPWECSADIPISELPVPEATPDEKELAQYEEAAAEAAILGTDEPADPA